MGHNNVSADQKMQQALKLVERISSVSTECTLLALTAKSEEKRKKPGVKSVDTKNNNGLEKIQDGNSYHSICCASTSAAVAEATRRDLDSKPRKRNTKSDKKKKKLLGLLAAQEKRRDEFDDIYSELLLVKDRKEVYTEMMAGIRKITLSKINARRLENGFGPLEDMPELDILTSDSEESTGYQGAGHSHEVSNNKQTSGTSDTPTDSVDGNKEDSQPNARNKRSARTRRKRGRKPASMDSKCSTCTCKNVPTCSPGPKGREVADTPTQTDESSHIDQSSDLSFTEPTKSRLVLSPSLPETKGPSEVPAPSDNGFPF